MPLIIGAGVIALIVLLIIIVSTTGSGPKKSAKECLKMFRDFDDKKIVEEFGEDTLKEFSLQDEDVDVVKIIKKNCKNVKYEILSCEEDGDHTTAHIRLKYRDGSEVFNVFEDKIKENVDELKNMSDDAADKIVMKMIFSGYDKIDIGDGEEKEEDIDLELVKSDKKWRVDGDCEGMSNLSAIFMTGMNSEDFVKGVEGAVMNNLNYFW